MGRKATFNDPARQVVQTVEDQHKYDTPTFRRLQVNAQPVNTFVQPDYTSQATTLQLAIAEAIPSLMQASQNAARVANQDEGDAGKAARLAEGGLDPEKSDQLKWYSSSGFKEGYWGTYGLEKGQIGKEQILADWDADPNRNAVPTNEWVANWYKQNTAGMNQYALNAFTREVSPVAMKLSNQGALEKIADVEASVYSKRYDVLTNDWKAGNWNPEVAKQRQEELGMSNTDFDSLQVKVLDQFARSGDNPQAAQLALKTMTEKRPDGTPGIAFKGNIAKSGWVESMSTQIDQWAISKNTARENADKSARTEQQRTVQNDIFAMAIDKSPQAAMAQLNKVRKENPDLWSPGIWMDTQEKIKRIQMLKKGDGDGEGNSAQYAGLVSKAIKGELGTDQIAELVDKQVIKVGQAGTLMSYATRSNSMDRAVFKTQPYVRAAGLLQSLPTRPSPTTPDPDGSIAATMSARRAMALSSLDEELLKDPKADPMVLSKNIWEAENKFINSGATANPTLNMYVPKYKSRAEFMQALQSNTVMPGVDVEKEKQQWDWLSSQGKGK